ncbi:MAG: hypothetical protein EU535_06285 [Promethearchaeota archaeon]|nr:MAG: hypothetical protein EU535_06285 [Candidatus Lokiarchaeota archaeon]
MKQPFADQIFTTDYMQLVQDFTKKSQNQTFPGDWVLEFIDGKGKPFTYGLNFSQCGFKFLCIRIVIHKRLL